eukprot:COSAG02_NODE_164_length_32230_cov_37.505587_1_plen_202_part_00
MAVFVVTEVLAVVLGVGSGQGGYADRFGQFPTTCGLQLSGWTGALSTSLASYFPVSSLYRTARESGPLSEASWRVCGWIRAQSAQEVCFGWAVSLAWLRRRAAGMAGMYERPAAPGGGLRDRRGRRRGSWARGESRRALVCADECTMLMCIFFVSSFHPAPSLLSRSKKARAAPCRHRRLAAGEARQGGKEWRGRKAPAPI